jgi:acyl-CoA thioesterase
MASNGIREGLADIEYLMKGSDASSFAQLMDLKIVNAEAGYARAQVTISSDKHLNFHGRTHGGVIFALADHACGLCGNSLGRKAVLVQSSINLLANPEVGSMIEAEARFTHVGETVGTMIIDVHTSNGQSLATCQSIVLFLK